MDVAACCHLVIHILLPPCWHITQVIAAIKIRCYFPLKQISSRQVVSLMQRFIISYKILIKCYQLSWNDYNSPKCPFLRITGRIQTWSTFTQEGKSWMIFVLSCEEIIKDINLFTGFSIRAKRLSGKSTILANWKNTKKQAAHFQKATPA